METRLAKAMVAKIRKELDGWAWNDNKDPKWERNAILNAQIAARKRTLLGQYESPRVQALVNTTRKNLDRKLSGLGRYSFIGSADATAAFDPSAIVASNLAMRSGLKGYLSDGEVATALAPAPVVVVEEQGHSKKLLVVLALVAACYFFCKKASRSSRRR